GALALLVVIVVVVSRRGKRRASPPQMQQMSQPQIQQPQIPQMPMYGRVQGPPQMGPPQMPPPQQPIAKTMAIQQGPNQSGGIAPTAFGSLSIGSLTCTRGQLMGHRFALTATGIIVGRQPGVAHILINDHRASGKHVWIGIDQGRLVAIDQGTTNGTYVND